MRELTAGWLGFLVFGASAFLVPAFLNVASDGRLTSLLTGTLYAGIVLALAALFYFRFHARAFAAGFVVGFVVATVASGGTCTGFVETEDPAPLLVGLVSYVALVVLSGIILAVAGVVRAVRNRRSG